MVVSFPQVFFIKMASWIDAFTLEVIPNGSWNLIIAAQPWKAQNRLIVKLVKEAKKNKTTSNWVYLTAIIVCLFVNYLVPLNFRKW